MKLTKAEIINHEFSGKLFGYRKSEVEQFLLELAEEVGQRDENARQQESRIASLEKELGEYKSRERSLRDSLLATHKMVDDIKANAEKEARLIIERAQARAEATLNKSHMRLAQIHEDITELKRQRTQFEVKLRALVEAHLRLLEMEDQDQEHMDALESKLKFLKNVQA